jgi:cytochrome c-type biogenesis protein CcmH
VPRLRRLALVLLAGLVLAAGAAAAEDAAPAEERWAYELAHELMSPFCPGRALAECPSPQADALRLWILQQARAGATREQVEAQLLESFGDQLRQAPRPEGVGLVAYVVPALLVVAGGGLLALFLRRQAQRAAPAAAAAGGAAVARDPELERRLDEELRS